MREPESNNAVHVSRIAFRSLIYRATYTGDTVQRREDVINDVLQPGETKQFEIVDTIGTGPIPDATVEIVAAEGLLPADGS